MFHKFYIKTEDKFNKNNFDDWFFSIKYILSFKESKKLNAAADDKTGSITPTESRKDISENSLATAIIIANIPKDALRCFKNLNNAFEIMENFKEIYKGNDSAYIQF
ncbi:hypothetical protein H8356DRAFT_1372969 [Neocallimastix lanati (nom. inval.)]|nr:hypothetical protein H8356DRAFT_1372969 [Neocallimastix sp. JGI-2020a]